MDYFYCPPEKISREDVLIDGEEFAHLVHVMRKKEGDEIRIIDGLGRAYDVRLGSIKKKMVRGAISQSYKNHHEPSISLTLAVGILKNPSKFDFLVEKVTELGVKEIIPIRTKRTIPSHTKIDRWQKLALAAMKQCGRSYLPKIRELTSLDDLLEDGRSFDRKIIAHEKGANRISVQDIPLGPSHSVIVLVGPEGGFSDEEFDSSVDAGFTPVTLGERRLRTETAAIVLAGQVILPESP
jgi:16S rRNA (uracil1498-N3)-methyltransferase